MLIWLLATESQGETPSALTEPLLQSGAIGAILVICLYAVYKLFNSLVASHKAELERIEAANKAAIERADAAYDKEVKRGDRLEAELRDLNKLVTEKTSGELVRATDAIREAYETMHTDRRRQ